MIFVISCLTILVRSSPMNSLGQYYYDYTENSPLIDPNLTPDDPWNAPNMTELVSPRRFKDLDKMIKEWAKFREISKFSFLSLNLDIFRKMAILILAISVKNFLTIIYRMNSIISGNQPSYNFRDFPRNFKTFIFEPYL